MRMPRYTPGVVESVNRETRRYRVRFPGTEGAEKLPEADVLYPLGDKSEHTEIRIVPGDRVWLDFFNGDPRFPIILGFRAKETDNAMEVRRWHHESLEIEAFGGNVTITATGQIVLNGDIVHTGTITSNGKNVGSTHTHSGVNPGGGVTGAPV